MRTDNVGTAGRTTPMTTPTAGNTATTIAGQGGTPAQAQAGQPAAAGGGALAGSGGSAGQSGSSGTTPTAGSAANSGPCEFPDPPNNISGWVNESWGDQLGNNIRSREAWNLDHVMLNKGYLNLCVRWGATMPVPASVRDNIAATTERWFNDWFKGLAGYGCFPYGDGIEVKVTGWAVRPGSEALLDGVDPAIPIYTEVDGEGEPKCPDACSSFVHWDHEFPDCDGGDANHTDYWLWFNDRLPGGGGAAAVGGDWGLRMPVSTFLDAFDKPSDHIVEHEMGHGFGFQDYYDWRGATPEGGSIMIVGSTDSASPTEADHWLLKRTWKEMKEMRGW
jgi:hypothetical protein